MITNLGSKKPMGLGQDHHCVEARNRLESDLSQYVGRSQLPSSLCAD